MAATEPSEERNKTQEIVKSLIDGLLVFDKENCLVLINPQAEKFLMVKKEKLIGQKIADFSKFEQLKNLADLIGTKIKENLFRQELKLTENFILEVSTVPLIASNRKIGVFGDIA